jgi:hypothetical protein
VVPDSARQRQCAGGVEVPCSPEDEGRSGSTGGETGQRLTTLLCGPATVRRMGNLTRASRRTRPENAQIRTIASNLASRAAVQGPGDSFDAH